MSLSIQEDVMLTQPNTPSRAQLTQGQRRLSTLGRDNLHSTLSHSLQLRQHTDSESVQQQPSPPLLSLAIVARRQPWTFSIRKPPKGAHPATWAHERWQLSVLRKSLFDARYRQVILPAIRTSSISVRSRCPPTLTQYENGSSSNYPTIQRQASNGYSTVVGLWWIMHRRWQMR